MSMNAPAELHLIFKSSGDQPVDAGHVAQVVETLRKYSNVGLEPDISDTGEIKVTFKTKGFDIQAVQETNSRIIPTIGTLIRDDRERYTVPQPEYDIFTDSLTCEITCH